MRMGWFVVSKISSADRYRWNHRYRALPWAGRSLSLTGPSFILVYILTGVFMYLMMRAIGEMLYMDPDQHTFINFITKYLGKVGDSFRMVLLGLLGIFGNGRDHRLFPTMSSFGFQIGQPGRFRLSF